MTGRGQHYRPPAQPGGCYTAGNNSPEGYTTSSQYPPPKKPKVSDTEQHSGYNRENYADYYTTDGYVDKGSNSNKDKYYRNNHGRAGLGGGYDYSYSADHMPEEYQLAQRGGRGYRPNNYASPSQAFGGGYDSSHQDLSYSDVPEEYLSTQRSGRGSRPNNYVSHGRGGRDRAPHHRIRSDEGEFGAPYDSMNRYGGSQAHCRGDRDRNFMHNDPRSFDKVSRRLDDDRQGNYGSFSRGSDRGLFDQPSRGFFGERGSDRGSFTQHSRGRGFFGQRGEPNSYEQNGPNNYAGPELGSGEWAGAGQFQESQPRVKKPQPPPKLSAEQHARIDNCIIKQLVAPKPPHRILKEMVGDSVLFEYIENPPLPPGMVENSVMHTLKTTIGEDSSSGTGPSHEIAKNICSENAVMGVVTRRYEEMNRLASEGNKPKAELLVEDPTPYELASIAIFKMFNEWEAKGYQLPADLEDVLYTSHMSVSVKERLSKLATAPVSNMQIGAATVMNRKGGLLSITSEELMNKNPVSLLNELRGNVEYVCAGVFGISPNQSFNMITKIDNTTYYGSGTCKKEAKRQCALDVLTRLYKLPIPLD